MEPATTATQENDPKSLLDRAYELLDTDPQQVLTLLASFEDLHPEHSLLATAYFLRGCALQDLGEHQKAADAFDKARLDFPPELNGPAFFLRQAISLNALAESQKALDAITHAEQTPEPFPQGSAAQGILLLQKGIALLGVGEPKRALDALRTASTLVQPGMATSNCWLQTGLALASLGELDEALKAFDHSLAEAPPDKTGATFRILAAFQKASALNRLQQTDKALEALEAALRELQATHPPGLPPTFETTLLISRANLLILLRRYDQAAAPLEEAEKTRPDLRTDVSFWVQKANAYFYARRYQEALLPPPPEIANHPMVLALRGFILNASGDLHNGRTELQRAAAGAANSGDDALAWTGVGLAQAGLLNYQAAVEALEKSRSLNPGLAAADPTVTYALGTSLVALQRYPEAWDVLKDLPDTDDMLLAKAMALQGLDKAPQALQTMERISPPLPTTPLLSALSYWIVLGALLGAVERPAESLKAFETASALAQQSPGAPLRVAVAVGRASALIKLERRDNAQDLLTKATAEPPAVGTPRPGAGWWLLGGLLAEKGKFEAALRAVNRAQSLEPDNVDIRLSKGKNLLNLEDYDYRQAEDVYKQALAMARTDQDRFEALLGQGIALHSLDRHEKAIDVFREALSLAPDDITRADSRLWVGLGKAYSSLDRHQTALRTFQEGWRLNIGPNKSSDLALGVSSILLGQKRDREAADFLLDAQQRAVPHSDIDLNLGIALYRLKQSTAAKQAWQRAADAGSQKAKEYLEDIPKAAPEAGNLMGYWFGDSAPPWRRVFGGLLVFLIMFVAALPVISKDAIHWLRWLNTGENYKLGWICMVPLVLIFLAPVLKKISLGLGPVKLEAATPEVTAKPNMDALLEKLQSSAGLPLSSSPGGSVSQWPTA
ncbi:MAG TPA: tetratricopeptide repeat protein [Terriglobales bacterium]|jgi:tetratricopeptide (TPR) repeat protein